MRRNEKRRLGPGLFVLMMAVAALAQPGGITQGPAIQYADDHLAVVAWTTASADDSKLAYGTSAENLSMTAQGAAGSTEHRVELTNLQAGTTYYFQVEGARNKSGVMSFETAAAGTAALRDQQPRMVAARLAEAPRVQYASESTLVLTWPTDTAAGSQVQYGTDAARLDQQAGTADSSTFHRVHLTGLRPGTTYYFRVETGRGKQWNLQHANRSRRRAAGV